MNPVIIRIALDELREVTTFYQQVGGNSLGLKFVAEFERALSLVVDNPNIGTNLGKQALKCPLRRFPYNLVYQVIGSELRVIAIAHQRRSPSYWTGRKQKI